MPATSDSPWLAGSHTRNEAAAALWIGSMGLLVLGLQPILLGAMFTEGLVDFDGLALIATVEIIAIAVGSVLFGVMGTRSGLRRKSALLLLAVAACDFAMPYVKDAGALAGLRGVAGLFEGGLVLVAIELIARARHAERLGGYFVTAQTLAQSVLALLLAFLVIPRWGAAGGFVAMGAACLLSVIVALWVAEGYAPMQREGRALDGVLTLRSVLALLCIFAFFCFIGAIWAFLEPIGARSAIDAQTVGAIVSASLAVQVVGSICATWAVERIGYAAGIAACSIVGIIAVLVLASGPGLAAFWTASLAIGFIWLFIIPCQIGMAVAADNSRMLATLVPAANLLGAALGPLFASFFIAGDDVSGVIWFALGAAMCSLMLFALFGLALRGAKSNG